MFWIRAVGIVAASGQGTGPNIYVGVSALIEDSVSISLPVFGPQIFRGGKVLMHMLRYPATSICRRHMQSKQIVHASYL